jgi:RNA-binding protein
MSLSTEKIKEYRRIGHKLKPVVIVGDAGLSEGVQQEIDRALNDHELIKIKVNSADREQKKLVISSICDTHGCILVQSIGNIALVYKQASGDQPALSNIARHYLYK